MRKSTRSALSTLVIVLKIDVPERKTGKRKRLIS